MSTFLVFFFSYPAHSDFLAAQAQHLFHQVVQLVLIFFGLLTPALHAPATQWHRAVHKIDQYRPAFAPSPILHTVTPVERPELMSLQLNGIHRMRTYSFQGKATLSDLPVPNASVLVRLTSGERSVTQGTITGPDGSYRLQASIAADAGDPVDWKVEAYTPDFKKVEIDGRKIVQIGQEQDPSPIVVNAPVEFIVSLPRQ